MLPVLATTAFLVRPPPTPLLHASAPARTTTTPHMATEERVEQFVDWVYHTAS